jgi:protein-tyrosine-phosphatase
VQRVLFICTNGAARGPIAAALLGHFDGGRSTAVCGALHPRGIHPATVAVLTELSGDIDIEDLRVGSMDGCFAERFDHVIVLSPVDDWPVFSSRPVRYWYIEDPAQAQKIKSKLFAKCATGSLL